MIDAFSKGFSIEYDALGDYKNAIKYINLAIKAYPKDGLYFMNRGSYNLELENFDQAVKDYEKAGELYLKYKNRKSGETEFINLDKLGKFLKEMNV